MPISSSPEDVLDALKHTQRLLQDITRERNESATKLATLKVKMDALEQDVRDLVQVIRGGSSGGVQVKLQKVESDIKSIESELKRIQASGLAEARGKWMLMAAVASGLVGIATALINVLVR